MLLRGLTMTLENADLNLSLSAWICTPFDFRPTNVDDQGGNRSRAGLDADLTNAEYVVDRHGSRPPAACSCSGSGR
jgi:hypothetical protein